MTGSNTGLGLGVCAAYAERGDEVIAACRRSSPELDALGVQVVEGVELTSDEAVRRLAHGLPDASLDVLVCNAAINTDSPGLDDIDVDELAHMFDVNALGVVRVVLALLPKLRDGSKIMLVGIGAQALNDLMIPAHSLGNYGYRMSKAALTSFGSGLARDLRGRGIAVVISSPGAVDTRLLHKTFAQGRTTRAVVNRARDPRTVGRLFRDRLDELTLDASPAWQAMPTGKPVTWDDRRKVADRRIESNGESHLGRIPKPPPRAAVREAEQAAYDKILERAAGRREEQFSPYLATLLHTPAIGAVISELGRLTRAVRATPGGYSAVDFELLVLALGLDFGFLWTHHLLDALAVGVRPAALEALLEGREERLEESERQVVEFARQVATGTMTDGSFAAMRARLGDRGTIELSIVVGFLVTTMRWLQAWGIPSATRADFAAMLERHRRGDLELPDRITAARMG